jgi:hypothetical protein
MQTSQFHFVSQARFIGRLKQPRPQLAVHSYRAANDNRRRLGRD